MVSFKSLLDKKTRGNQLICKTFILYGPSKRRSYENVGRTISPEVLRDMRMVQCVHYGSCLFIRAFNFSNMNKF